MAQFSLFIPPSGLSAAFDARVAALGTMLHRYNEAEAAAPGGVWIRGPPKEFTVRRRGARAACESASRLAPIAAAPR